MQGLSSYRVQLSLMYPLGNDEDNIYNLLNTHSVLSCLTQSHTHEEIRERKLYPGLPISRAHTGLLLLSPCLIDPQVRGQQTLSAKGLILNILGFVGLKYLGFSGLEAKLCTSLHNKREKKFPQIFLMKIKI